MSESKLTRKFIQVLDSLNDLGYEIIHAETEFYIKDDTGKFIANVDSVDGLVGFYHGVNSVNNK